MHTPSFTAEARVFFLKTRFGRMSFLVVTLLLASAYVATCVQWYRGAALARSYDEGDLQRAQRINPGNAEAYFRLGLYSQYITHESARAMENYREAVRLNPWSARYWFTLAIEYQVAGDQVGYRQAVAQALAAEPMRPDLAWDVAVTEVVAGDMLQALRHMRIVIANDPVRTVEALRLCLRAAQNPNLILGNALPPNTDAYLAFVDLLLQGEQTKAAAAAWQRMVELRLPVTPQQIDRYVRYLIGKREVDQAVHVWRDMSSLNPALAAYVPSQTNLVVNGSFERDLLNRGFDWRCSPPSGVTVSVDTTEFRGGNRSLHLQFDGVTFETAGIEQFVAVRPNTTYRLAFSSKGEELVGIGGLAALVYDAYSHSPLVTIQAMGAPGIWHDYSNTFRTGPDTRLVILTFPHMPASSVLRGNLWLDDVEIVEEKN
jgi:tetratricopeptide (TPR) repeat protein